MNGIPLTPERQHSVIGTNPRVVALLRDRDRPHYILVVVGQKGSPSCSYESKSYFWSPDGTKFFTLEGGYSGSSTQKYEMIEREWMVHISPTHEIHVGLKVILEKQPFKASAIVTVADPALGIRMYDQVPNDPHLLSKITLIVPNDSIYVLEKVARFENGDILALVFGDSNYEHHVMKVDKQTSQVEEVLTALDRRFAVFRDGGTVVASAGSESIRLPSFLTRGSGMYAKDGVKKTLEMDWSPDHSEVVELLRPRFPLLFERAPSMVIPFE